MAYRIVEITKPSEVHVTNHQLIVEQEEAKFSIPLEDIEIIICIGAKIRFSTMGLGEITQAGIIVVGFGKKHEAQTLIEPYFPNQRHVTLLQNQINMNEDFKNQLWDKIIKRKILNSARNLAILGLEGFEKNSEYSSSVKNGDEKNIETMAAQEYFQFYHKGLNWRTSDPVNSALNYGYAIIRSYIIKALISTGFHCALGLHHHNEYNSFNLADDLIEPCRAMIEQAAFSIIGNDINLSTKQRRGLTGVLHKNCEIDGIIMQISNGIEIMVDSLKNSILQQNIELLKIPILLDFNN